MLEATEQSFSSSRWAVIKDARRRQRQRHRRMLAAAAAMVLVAIISWMVVRGSDPRLGATSPGPTPGPVEQLQLGGTVVDTTTLGGNVWVLTCERYCSRPFYAARTGQLIELNAEGRAIKRIRVADPTALTGGGGAIWIAHAASGAVTRVDAKTGQTTATHHLELPKAIDTQGDRRFLPAGIAFGADQVLVSSWRGWTAAISSRAPQRPARMIWSSSEVTSTTTAAGLTWIADELDGVGTNAPNSKHVSVHRIFYVLKPSYAGNPVDIASVAHGAGRIWALGSVSVGTPTRPDWSLDIVTAIDPQTGRIIRQWRIPGADSIVFANGSPYVGESGLDQVTRLTGPRRSQILHLQRRVAGLTAATPHALWATTLTGQLLRIDLTTP